VDMLFNVSNFEAPVGSLCPLSNTVFGERRRAGYLT